MPDIRADQLIDRLQRFALGSDGNAMSDSQVAAAMALLDRVLPNVHRIELHAADGQPILLTVEEPASRDDASARAAID
jgi:hypothetical protein